jgi:penicillin amidase
MRRLLCLLVTAAGSCGHSAPSRPSQGEIVLPGLEQPVEVLRDRWGIPHIYAKTQRDLFRAQGYVVAQDRLWQMEMWRRTGEGTLAEVLGPSAIPRDRFARLVKYRGDMEAEWTSYAPDAKEIIEAFVAGVNAAIAARKGRLPVEFGLLGFEPAPWTPEACITRMAGYIMMRNAASEVTRAQLVREVGPEAAAEIAPPDPLIPIEIPKGLDLSAIDDRILADARAAGGSIDLRHEGSNNWTVSGALTKTGKPILANDPHRTIAIPALRYLAHLVGPGWNVIGAGEPALPGVAAGHNDRVAFGFTIVGIDQQDLYVEELNPADPIEYRHRGAWRKMDVVREEIRVRGRAEPERVELRFTVHGPVIFEDRAKNRAFSLRWVGREPGTAGYLACLSMNRARNWDQFLGSLDRWKIPSENLVYADVEGNIGWMAAGLTPIRKGWSGLLPVPGNGDYEWQGFRPMAELPKLFNPPQGYIATANHNILPAGYPHPLGHEWASDWRFRRIDEVLRSRKGWTVADFEALQHDEHSLPARRLVPLLKDFQAPDAEAREAARNLLAWDRVLRKESSEAAIFEVWLRKLLPKLAAKRLPPKLAAGRPSLEVAIRWLEDPPLQVFGPDAAGERDRLLVQSLSEALAELRQKLGADPARWSWGALHQVHFLHPLGKNDDLRKLLDRGPAARGGDANTVNNTSAAADYRQTHGASFRMIADLSDWDRSVATSAPGQSGEPGSPHYDDLLPLWAEGRYFPLVFSRAAVERETRERLLLKPAR